MQTKCRRRIKTCKNKECAYRFKPKGTPDYKLWKCPKCGTDRHCENTVRKKGVACFLHGGKSLKGIASKTYKGKGYSKYIPKDLIQDHDDFYNDPERLTVSKEMALARTMLLHELEAWGKVHTTDAWNEIGRKYRQIVQNITKGKDVGRLLGELGVIIEQGAGQSEHLESIRKQTETVRRLVDTERQIFVDRGELVAKGAIIMVIDIYTTKLFELAETAISDVKERNNILRGLSEIWTDVFGGVSQIKD